MRRGARLHVLTPCQGTAQLWIRTGDLSREPINHSGFCHKAGELDESMGTRTDAYARQLRHRCMRRQNGGRVP